MNWEAIGAIAELIGAAGVITTLVYLSVQIRNSANVDRANIRASLTEGSQELVSLTIEHSDLIVRANDGEKLTPSERFTLLQIHRFAFRGYENYAYQRNLGLFDESEWQGFVNAIAIAMTNPYVQEDWRAMRSQFSGAVQKIMDPLLPNDSDHSKVPIDLFVTSDERSAT